MRSVEDTRPRRGLSVPVVTVLARSGELAEDDQRRLVRYVIQDGNGAAVIFAAGTTGEWDKLPADLQKVVRDSVIESQETQRKAVRDDDENLLKDLKAKGMQVTMPDHNAFRAATAPAYDAFYAKFGDRAKKIIETIRGM